MTEHGINLDRVFEDAEREEVGPITLSSGAIVKAKRIPDNIILTLRRQNPPPKPPIVRIELEGRRPRDEENPNDPNYTQALEDYQIELANKMTDLILLAGMEIVELPEGILGLGEDEGWKEELEAVGIDIPLGKTSQRLLWIRYKVAPLGEDLESISAAYAREADVSEEEIKAAEDQFRGEAGRDSGQGVGTGS